VSSSINEAAYTCPCGAVVREDVCLSNPGYFCTYGYIPPPSGYCCCCSPQVTAPAPSPTPVTTASPSLTISVSPPPPWSVGESLTITVSLQNAPSYITSDTILVYANGTQIGVVQVYRSLPLPIIPLTALGTFSGSMTWTIPQQYAGQRLVFTASDIILHLTSNAVAGMVTGQATPTTTPTTSPTAIPTVPTLPTTFISPPPSAIPSVQKPSKTGLIIGGVVGAAAVAGLLYFLLRHTV